MIPQIPFIMVPFEHYKTFPLTAWRSPSHSILFPRDLEPLRHRHHCRQRGARRPAQPSREEPFRPHAGLHQVATPLQGQTKLDLEHRSARSTSSNIRWSSIYRSSSTHRCAPPQDSAPSIFPPDEEQLNFQDLESEQQLARETGKCPVDAY